MEARLLSAKAFYVYSTESYVDVLLNAFTSAQFNMNESQPLLMFRVKKVNWEEKFWINSLMKAEMGGEEEAV